MSVNTKKYLRELRKEYAELTKLMKQTWGVAPDVGISLAPVVVADFNIKGFAHEGRKFSLTPKNVQGYRTPRRVARAIAQEITSHRNTCNDCGERVPAIWQRVWHAKAALGLQSWGSDLNPDGSRKYVFYDKLPEPVKVYPYKDNPSYYYYQRHTTEERTMHLIPADAVERKLHPQFAKLIDRAIAKLEGEGRWQPTAPRSCPVPK